MRVTADCCVDPAPLRRADPLAVAAAREAGEAVRPELEREPGREEAERRRAPEAAARAGAGSQRNAAPSAERDEHGDDRDAVAAGEPVAEIPPRLQAERVRLRSDVQQAEERDRAGQRRREAGGGDRRARRPRLAALDPGEQRETKSGTR